jgi:acyl carrier protein
MSSSPETVEGRIKKLIVERLFLDVEPDDIASDASLIDEYDLESVRLLELVVGCEEEFGISFEDDDFSVEKFETVKSIAAVVQEKLG